MSLYEAAKDAVKIAQKADNVELVQKVLDIQKEALDMQEKIQNKNEQIERIKSENIRLAVKLAAKEQYELEYAVYWRIDDNEKNQPYCPTCYSKNIILPMQKSSAKVDGHQSRWSCSDKTCGTNANPWNISPAQRVHTY